MARSLEVLELWRRPMSKIWMIGICCLVLSCAVRERPGEPMNSIQKGTALPEKLYLGKDRKALLSVSTLDLKPFEENEIEFRIVSTDGLEPLIGKRGFSIDIQYSMPTMLEMNNPPPTVVIDGNRIRATFLIVHGGLWEFSIRVLENDATIDTITYQVNVPENR